MTSLRRLPSDAPCWLRLGGCFICEKGLGQDSTSARPLDRKDAFAAVETADDDEGQVRVATARRVE